LWAILRGRRFASPELEQAGIIFRLERYGVRCARILAFGQTRYRPWNYQSFVLVQDRKGMAPDLWLAEQANCPWTAKQKQRRRLLRGAGTLLRQMHQAQCYLPPKPGEILVVENSSNVSPDLLLKDASSIRKQRRSPRRIIKKNLRTLFETLGLSNLSQTDRLRILLGYTDQDRLTPSVKKLAVELMR
jgi:hypothetical protein